MTAPPPSPQPRRYVLPRRRRGWRRPGGISALAGAALVVAAIGTVAGTGHARLASPGPLSRHHAAANATCAACHRIRSGVEDLRCTRCHADGGTNAFSPASHAAAASPLRTTAAHQAGGATCASCHDDHRGAAFAMTDVPDQRCVRCHERVSLARHPEFAALQSGPATGGGIALSHKRHLAEVRKIGRSCDACHERGDRDAAFAPISFERHCASCHTKGGLVDGTSDPIDPALLLPVPPGAASPVVVPVERGRVQIRAAHRDPWVLANLRRWRRQLSPEATAADRLTAVERLAEIDGLAAIEAPGDPAAAVDALAADLRSLSAPAAVPAGRADLRPQLLALLDAIDARGDAALSAAAAHLRSQVAAASPPAATDDRNHEARLTVLSTAVQQLGTLPDAAARGDEAAIGVLLRAARGTSRADAGERLLAMLDAIEMRDPASALRVDGLRARVEEGMSGPGTAAALARAATSRAATRARAALDAELQAVPVPAEATPSPRVAGDLAWLAQARTRLSAVVAAADRAATLPPLPATATADAVRRAADALTRACAKCHDTSGARIAPVAAARPVLTGAVFSHAPHVSRRTCADCHGSVVRSVVASDVNLPGIATCRTCHGARVAPATCRTCHRYHQPASAPLRGATWTMGSAF